MSSRFERQVKQKFHSWMYKIEKRFIKNPAFLFYNTLKMLLQNIFYLTLRVPKSVVNYNKLKFQLNFNSN